MAGALADLVLLVHLGYILFVIGGGLLALRWPRAAWFHLPALAWATLIALMGWICPLTPLENWLRAQGGLAMYERGFIEHYVFPIVYPSGLTPGVQWGLAGLLLAANAGVYALLLHRRTH
ncbi:MAG: DUF2784 domain-containing protein [Myxococcota bacterium]